MSSCMRKKNTTLETVLIAVKARANEMNMREQEDVKKIDGGKSGWREEHSASSMPRGEVWGTHPQSFDLALHLKAGSG